MAFKMKGPYHKAFKNVGKSGVNEAAYRKVTHKSTEREGGSITVDFGNKTKEKTKVK
tara:strand:+ start:186 stop:356 length:171 start_codon:yes stop_codon:yes gene_type:complete